MFFSTCQKCVQIISNSCIYIYIHITILTNIYIYTTIHLLSNFKKGNMLVENKISHRWPQEPLQRALA